MAEEDHHIEHLNEVIAHLKTIRGAVIRGYEQAMEELGNKGDYENKNWSEAYEFLKGRVAQMRNEQWELLYRPRKS
jgi:hypothetical protein